MATTEAVIEVVRLLPPKQQREIMDYAKQLLAEQERKRTAKGAR